MKLEINEIKQLKKLINSLTDEAYIAEAMVRVVGNSAMLPMPKNWVGKKVKYVVVLEE